MHVALLGVVSAINLLVAGAVGLVSKRQVHTASVKSTLRAHLNAIAAPTIPIDAHSNKKLENAVLNSRSLSAIKPARALRAAWHFVEVIDPQSPRVGLGEVNERWSRPGQHGKQLPNGLVTGRPSLESKGLIGRGVAH